MPWRAVRSADGPVDRRAARCLQSARPGLGPDRLFRRAPWWPRAFEPFLATLRAALAYSGGVRIDHIMGLMRLWLIPRGQPAGEGAYLAYPLEDLLDLLALESHRQRAVVIGEDLGTVPPGFRARLRRAGIAGMDVLWFERTRLHFKKPSRWRADAVAMTSTHDLPTVAGWWNGEDIRTRRALGLGAPGEDQARQQDRARLWRAFANAGLDGRMPPPPTSRRPTSMRRLATSPSRGRRRCWRRWKTCWGSSSSPTCRERSMSIPTGVVAWSRRRASCSRRLPCAAASISSARHRR